MSDTEQRSAYERDDAADEKAPAKVLVPTGVDELTGRPTGWMECEPEAASHWDATRWERLT